jgi:FdhD protein
MKAHAPRALVPKARVIERSAAPASLGADPGLGRAEPVSRAAFTRLDGARTATGESAVAEEVPVALVYAGRPHAVVMATPADLEDLAVGFTVTEGIVAHPTDVADLRVERHARGIEVRVAIPPADAVRLGERTRAIPARTGCGLCGVDAIDDAVRAVAPVASSLAVPRAALWRAARALEGGQRWNAETHAVHAAAWCTPDGACAVVREDVGRHNALDKVLGALWRAGRDPAEGFVVVTSRASVELVQKCATAGVPLLAAVSRPTALAIRMAERANVTLVGLLRGEGGNVYAHGERVH